jgi:hypothetical protein
VLAAVRVQLRECFAGKRREFEVGLAARGSEFQQRVWAALRSIPPGETRSYGELARTLGRAAGAGARCGLASRGAGNLPRRMAKPLVGIIMGSTSDWETMQHAAAQLNSSRIRSP